MIDCLKTVVHLKRTIIHFYYDKIPHIQYLKAEFFIKNSIPQITFRLEFEEDSEISDIIKNHFNSLELLERYQRQCVDVLSQVCEEIKSYVKEGIPVEDCLNILEKRADSFKKTYGLNHWEACIYEAMSQNREALEEIV